MASKPLSSDLDARKRGLSLAKALGARRLSESIECNAFLCAQSVEEAEAEVQQLIDCGYRSVKIKVSNREWPEFEKILALIRSCTQDDFSIRVDANQTWSPQEAQRCLDRLSNSGIEYIEEPLTTASPQDLRSLRQASSIPIALDESLRSLDDLNHYARNESLDVAVLKATRLGGPRNMMVLARRALELGLKVVITDSIDSLVGQALAAHLAAATNQDSVTIGIGGRSMAKVRTDPRVEVHGPGLGVEWRELEEFLA